MNSLDTTWVELHSGSWKNIDNKNLAASWARCKAAELPRNIELNFLSKTEFEKLKMDTKSFFAVSTTTLKNVSKQLPNYSAGIALFDPDCHLLRLYGSSHFFSYCESKGIAAGSFWGESELGANAVNIGMRHKESFRTTGMENYAELFSDCFIIFYPVFQERRLQISADHPILKGGIAIFGPMDEYREGFDALAMCIAQNLMLRQFIAQPSATVPPLLKYPSFTIDYASDAVKLIHTNSAFAHTFKLPYNGICYENLERLAPRIPENETFWEIIDGQKNYNQLLTTVVINNVKYECNMTSRLYQSANVWIKGMEFSLLPAASQARARELVAMNTFNDIIGESEEMAHVINLAKVFARSQSNMLIVGESGVGKDIFAQAIHNESERAAGPFVAINCAAIPKDLIVSELFGYESGAFTGAQKNGKAGKFELANNGTLFLDEIGDMPLELQATLLRALESKSFMRLGSNKLVNINVRIIAATNADIFHKIEQGEFRADLYYRLGVMNLQIPPLRNRVEDIPLLANAFLEDYTITNGKPGIVFSSEAAEQLKTLPLYGNVRELQNLVERLVLFNITGVILPEDIEEQYYSPDKASHHPQVHASIHKPVLSRGSRKKQSISKEDIEEALRACNFRRGKAAEYLGVSRKTLYLWMKNYSIE